MGNRTVGEINVTTDDVGEQETSSYGEDAGTPDNAITRLKAIIEKERRSLIKAEAVLGCLAIAMEERPDQDENSPYYPDVAEVVLDMVRHSVDQLDSVNLARATAE